MKRLSRDEARRIAANITKLPGPALGGADNVGTLRMQGSSRVSALPQHGVEDW